MPAMQNNTNIKKYKILAPLYDLLMGKPLNRITSFLGTDINRRFDEILSNIPLKIIHQESSVLNGNYKIIVLKKCCLRMYG